MQKNDIIKGYGVGSLPRILITINGFRRRYGSWPTILQVDAVMADALQRETLTPRGWQAIVAKLQIQDAKGTVIAEDENGQVYEYGSESNNPASQDSSADYWLWGCEVWPSSE